MAGFFAEIPPGPPAPFLGGDPIFGARGRAPLSGVPEETPGGGAGGKNSFPKKTVFIKKTFFVFFIDRV